MMPLDGGTPLQLIEQAGRTAYQSQDKITPDSAADFVRKIMERGHESVIEHSCMTIRFDNCSRGFTHELVRHRLMSVTQESTRYVDESDFEVVVPPHQKPEQVVAELENYADGCDMIQTSMETVLCFVQDVYRALRAAGWPAQDARQVLPIAIKSQIVCTTNFREWRHIFKTRTEQHAHWEIRRVMIQLLADVQTRVPVVFDDIKPEFTAAEANNWNWCAIDIPRPLCDWVSERIRKEPYNARQ